MDKLIAVLIAMIVAVVAIATVVRIGPLRRLVLGRYVSHAN